MTFIKKIDTIINDITVLAFSNKSQYDKKSHNQFKNKIIGFYIIYVALFITLKIVDFNKNAGLIFITSCFLLYVFKNSLFFNPKIEQESLPVVSTPLASTLTLLFLLIIPFFL